ncbi:MAG: DUF1186 domain-containing protein [Pirellulales bacterium]
MTTEAVTDDNLESTLDQIIRDLHVPAHMLPEAAIRAAQRHRDQIVPRLAQAIRDATASATAGHVPADNLHFFAFFLLTEFRAKEALPAILEAISLPGELPFDLFGDAVTETLRHTLATLAGDQPEILDALIANRALNEYVRIEAASAFLYLVRDGLMTRDAAVASLQRHLRQAIVDEDYEVIAQLISTLLYYGPQAARADIQEAFRRDLVDDFVIDSESAEQCIDRGDAEFQDRLAHCGPTGIDDTFDKLRRWATFDPRDDVDDLGSPFDLLDEDDLPGVDDLEDLDDAADDPIPSLGPIRNSQPKIGRNDPCPCGSGKKFKKCCGAH